MPLAAAQRYAQALFEYSQERKAEDAILSDVIQINRMIEASPELTQFLADPTMPTGVRNEILTSVFKGKMHDLTSNFITLLIEKDRLELLKPACLIYKDIYQKAKKLLKVKIFSREQLPKKLILEINKHLKSKFKKEISEELFTDAHCIGGIKLQIEDMIYDYTFKSQLDKFKKELLTA